MYNHNQASGCHDFYHDNKWTDAEYWVDAFAYRIHFLRASQTATVTKGQSEKHYYNYFLGNEPQKWAGSVYPSREIQYSNLYPGIDLKVYSADHNFKYDWIIHPGSDPSDIELHYEGTEGLSVKDGNLVIKTGFTEVTEMKPYAWQEIDGKQIGIPCRYVLKGEEVHFEVSDYDPSRPLIIDPVMIVSTYSGSGYVVWGCTATYDAAGDLYTAGACFQSGINGYPTTVGTFQVNFAGGTTDVAISKYNPSGSSLIYATYLGGSGVGFPDYDIPQSMMVNSNNQLVVMGSTGSTNFPMMNAYDNTFNGGGWDMFVAVFNATGTGLVGSSYIGGAAADGVSQIGYNSTSDYSRCEIVLDASDNIYIASSTTSANFPVTSGAYQSNLRGVSDAVICKLNPTASTLLWSTYLGSPGDDAAYSLCLDNSNGVYVVGGTDTLGFPTTAGSNITTYQGGNNDGFVAHLNNTGTALLASTLSGTGSYDQVFMVDRDNNGDVWILGQSESLYPVSAGVYSSPNGNVFVQKLDTNLSNILLSTIIGGGANNIPEIVPTAFMVDQCGGIYLAGYKDYGKAQPLPITPGAFQSTAPSFGFYFAVLDPDLAGLAFSTYWGSNSFDHVDAGPSRFDPAGNIYQAVCSPSYGFPTTANAYSPSTLNNGYDCIGIKIEFQHTGVMAAMIPSVTTGCAPLQVSFQNNSTGASQYQWSFGDGTTDTAAAPAHTYTSAGVYTVTLIASDAGACNGSDTVQATITVSNDSVAAGFTFTTSGTCDSLVSQFNSNAVNASAINWYFGDGATGTGNNPTHAYTIPGSYTIMQVVTNPSGCVTNDTAFATIIFEPSVTAAFTVTDVCLSAPLVIQNNSAGATGFLWDFGDGTQIAGSNPQHTYTTLGSYSITLIASNPASCNKADTVGLNVNIFAPPLADFQVSPSSTGEPGQLFTLTDLSTGASQWNWSLGDGTTSFLQNAQVAYTQAGTYNICLLVTSIEGCQDSICKKVSVLKEFEGGIYLPTAFSPNGDGVNDQFLVYGGGISDMHLVVYNRWGQILFESFDQSLGWDGTFKGIPQNIEVYAYMLIATMADGSQVSQSGNVTLLR